MVKNIDLLSNPKRSFHKLSVPLVAFTVFSSLYGIIDVMWISTISYDAFLSIGIASPFITLFYSFGDSFGQGTNSIMSRYLGSNHYKDACNSFITGIIVIIVIYAILLVTMTQFDFILNLIFDDSITNHLVLSYLIPMTVFSFPFLFSNFFSETLQAEGNSKFPTLILITTNILNLILDPVFIHTLGWGVEGAAYASIVSGLISFLILLFWYVSGRSKITIKLEHFKIRLYIVGEILKVAIPNCFEDSSSWFFKLFLAEFLIMIMGDSGIILYVVSQSLKQTLLSPIKGIGRGLLSVSGHLFGSKQFDEVKSLFNYALKIGVISSFAISIIFFIFHVPIFEFFGITEYPKEIFHIAHAGIVILTISPIPLISGKLLDGFGKSYYSLLFKVLKKILEAVLITVLIGIFTEGWAILLSFVASEIFFAFLYTQFTYHLFKTFKDTYKNKEVVKTF